jgi:hypothetical protein
MCIEPQSYDELYFHIIEKIEYLEMIQNEPVQITSKMSSWRGKEHADVYSYIYILKWMLHSRFKNAFQINNSKQYKKQTI